MATTTRCACRTRGRPSLQPWYDVEPDAVLPDAGAVADLLEKVDRSGLTKRDDIALQMQ